MTGILVVDKPAGFTSFDVVAKLRGICQTRKIGHGGTLDPMATGVLPVFVGTAAKAVDLAPRQDKAYLAELALGLGTDTGDITGQVLHRSDAVVDEAALCRVLPAFVGTQQQIPPMYSAVKVRGKPLYKYAREGKTVARKAREITIHSIDYKGQSGDNRFRLAVHCSKGTYIRTLCEDIGAALGVPATLVALRRTRAGVFAEDETWTLDAIQAKKDAGQLAELLLPVERLFAGMPAVTVNAAARTRLENGAVVQGLAAAAGRYRVVQAVPGGAGVFLGLGRVDEGGRLKAEKLLIPRGE